MSRTDPSASSPRPVPFAREEESEESQRAAGRLHPASVLALTADRRRLRFVIRAGNSDDVHVFREEHFLYVVSINSRLGYFGVERFYLEDAQYVHNDPATEDSVAAYEERGRKAYWEPAASGERFFQNASEEVGEDWDTKTPRQLLEHYILQEV